MNMVYDIDDWQFTHHQKAKQFGPIQIDEMCEYEGQAKSYWSQDIQYDMEYWEDRLTGKRKKNFRFLSDEIREAKRTVATFPLRKYINQQSKNYQIELAKYNRAVKLLEDIEDDED